MPNRHIQAKVDDFKKIWIPHQPSPSFHTVWIAFGRFVARDRQRARLGRPETFDFLGFTHICGRKRGSGHFQLVRKTRRRSKWTAVGRIVEGLRRLRHAPIDKQGRWLASVLKGHYAYFSVPTNIAAVRAVRHHAKVRWYLSLRRL